MNAPLKNRRHFLQDALRYPVLALLVGVGITVRKGSDERIVLCESRDACHDCSLSKRCSLKPSSAAKPKRIP